MGLVWVVPSLSWECRGPGLLGGLPTAHSDVSHRSPSARLLLPSLLLSPACVLAAGKKF